MKKSSVDNSLCLDSANFLGISYLSAVTASLGINTQVPSLVGSSIRQEKLEGEEAIPILPHDLSIHHACNKTKVAIFNPIKFASIAVKFITRHFVHHPTDGDNNRIALKQEVVKNGYGRLADANQVLPCMWNKKRRWPTTCFPLLQNIKASLWIEGQGLPFCLYSILTGNKEYRRLARSSPGPPIAHSYLTKFRLSISLLS